MKKLPSRTIAFRLEARSISRNDLRRSIPFFTASVQHYGILADHIAKLSDLQKLHYASSEYSVLIIFQAMVPVGKDFTIRPVMSGMNPQGCQSLQLQGPERYRT